MSPDLVHRLIIFGGRIAQSNFLTRGIIRMMWRRDDKSLEQEVLGLNFKNPVGLSAGFDKNIELSPLMRSVGFGFETGGSVTLAHRKGNPRPWFFRLPDSGSIVVNAGLANQGLVNMRRRIRRHSRLTKGMPLIVSVAVVASTAKETCSDAIIDTKNTILHILQYQLADIIEINISCPNAGDDQPFSQPDMLGELLTQLDTIERDVPFFVKMPNLPRLRHFDSLLAVIVEHRIQGVTIANLVKDRENVKLAENLPDDIGGGLSGTPTRYRSTELVRRTYAKYGDRLVIIGVGGIFTAEHAYEKIRAGASLVGMITGVIFEGPQVIGKINKGLVELLKQDGFSSITEAVGADNRKLLK